MGLILWLTWLNVEKHFDLFKTLSDWGVKGLKIDFMDRSDQWMTNYIERVAAKAAENHLLVDFHGAHKPTGLDVRYPNVISYEGVRGMEQMGHTNPDNSLWLPFMRNAVGPMDYTPGIFDINYDRAKADPGRIEWNGRNDYCKINTTLARQIANWVIIYSPLQMAADLIENYEGHEAFQFFRDFDADCDWSRALQGEIGKYIAVVRRAGDRYFLGAGTNSEARTIEVSLDFLKPGVSYQAAIYADDPAGDATKVAIEKKTVISTDTLTVAMNAAGGQAITFIPAE